MSAKFEDDASIYAVVVIYLLYTRTFNINISLDHFGGDNLSRSTGSVLRTSNFVKLSIDGIPYFYNFFFKHPLRNLFNFLLISAHQFSGFISLRLNIQHMGYIVYDPFFLIESRNLSTISTISCSLEYIYRVFHR